LSTSEFGRDLEIADGNHHSPPSVVAAATANSPLIWPTLQTATLWCPFCHQNPNNFPNILQNNMVELRGMMLLLDENNSKW